MFIFAVLDKTLSLTDVIQNLPILSKIFCSLCGKRWAVIIVFIAKTKNSCLNVFKLTDQNVPRLPL